MMLGGRSSSESIRGFPAVRSDEVHGTVYEIRPIRGASRRLLNCVFARPAWRTWYLVLRISYAVLPGIPAYRGQPLAPGASGAPRTAQLPSHERRHAAVRRDGREAGLVEHDVGQCRPAVPSRSCARPGAFRRIGRWSRARSAPCDRACPYSSRRRRASLPSRKATTFTSASDDVAAMRTAPGRTNREYWPIT